MATAGKTPITIWIVVTLLASYGAYNIWLSIDAKYWPAAPWGLLAMAGCVGLVFQKRWSQYIVYTLSIVFPVNWGNALWQAAGQGWPYPGHLDTVISLLPGIALLLLFAGGSLVVYRYFRALDVLPRQ